MPARMKKIISKILLLSGCLFYLALIIIFLLYPQYANYTEQTYLSSARTLFFNPEISAYSSLTEDRVNILKETGKGIGDGEFDTILLNEKTLLVKLKKYDAMMLFIFDDTKKTWVCYSNFKLKNQCN
jgi:hypothetical protein